jgi:hypothetical protein
MCKLYYAVIKTREGLIESQEELKKLFPGEAVVVENPTEFFKEHEDVGDEEVDDDDDDSNDKPDEGSVDEDDGDDDEDEILDEYDEEEDSDLIDVDDANLPLPDGNDLSSKLIRAFAKRSKKLCHDYAIAASLLSVHPDIYKFWKENIGIKQRDAMDRVLKRQLLGLCCDDEDDLNKALATFWREFSSFQNKTGPFEPVYIWDSKEAKGGESHTFHCVYSYNFTTVIGKIACRLTSKILGIGQAERNWKVVKRLKKSRPKLKIDSLEKQSIIVATAGMQKARLKLKKDYLNQLQWLEEDEKYDLGLNNMDVDADEANKKRTDRPVRRYNAWFEEWEKKAVKKNDSVVEQKLLRKYENLEFLDQDDQTRYRIIPDNLDWKKRLGWHVMAAPLKYKGDGTDDDLLESFKIDDGLIVMIEMTTQPVYLNVKMLKLHKTT